jgi:hypothetical protein
MKNQNTGQQYIFHDRRYNLAYSLVNVKNESLLIA